jgi:hypothetical protein
MVSWVVKVLEATMKRCVRIQVVEVSRRWVPSTLETKWTRKVVAAVRAERRADHLGPEVGAADADVDDIADGSP